MFNPEKLTTAPIIEGAEDKKEREKEPKVSFDILYGSHLFPNDLKKIENTFDDADIYVPEQEGWSKGSLLLFNEISKGNVSAAGVAQEIGIPPNSFQFKQLKMIEGSKKPILFVDLPSEHKLVKKQNKIRESWSEVHKSFAKGDFELALEKERWQIKSEADYQKKREEFMRKHLEKEVQKLIKENPQLKNKEKVKVLLRMGIAHTRLHHDLKKHKLPVSEQFTSTPLPFSSSEEAIRRAMFSKEISDELLARGIFESLIFQNAIKVTDDSVKANLLRRKISSKLSLEDIKKISKEFDNNPGIAVVDCLKKQNIKIPKTKMEAEEMLRE